MKIQTALTARVPDKHGVLAQLIEHIQTGGYKDCVPQHCRNPAPWPPYVMIVVVVVVIMYAVVVTAQLKY